MSHLSPWFYTQSVTSCENKEDTEMRIGYIRVSTVDQNLDRQVESLSKFNIEKWFEEKISGKDMNRPELKKMLDFVREGDEVYVEDWSRLSRSVTDLLSTVNLLAEKKVRLISIKENFDTSTPTGKLMLTLIAAINQFEREVMLERQREGIACAKAKGNYKGRKPKEIESDLLNKVMKELADKQISVTEASKLLGVSRGTMYNIIKRIGNV